MPVTCWAEISAQDLTFSVINNKDIKITVKGDENQGIILSNVYNKNFLNRLDKIIFSDGNEFLLKDMKMTVNSPNGTIYNDIIHYTEGGTINGGEGNDDAVEIIAVFKLGHVGVVVADGGQLADLV